MAICNVYEVPKCSDWISLVAWLVYQSPLDPGCEQSPTVKSIDTARVFYCHECDQVTLIEPLFGTMLHPCKEEHWDPLTLLSAGSRNCARTLALQDAERAWAESEADYSLRSSGSLASYDRDSCSWKMSQLFASEADQLSSENWPAEGMTVGGSLYRLRTSERTTGGNGGGYWPTPRANKVGGYASPGFSPTLEQAVRWPTPRAQSSRGTGPSRTGNRADLQTRVGGKLNPVWIEWLMNYPSGWTALEPWVTQWFRPKRGKRLKD
jgi:hypothetical protein